MIKIDKDISMNETPPSLRPPRRINFHPRNVARASKTTNARRFELIAHGAYIDTDKYNSRYKTRDIKRILISLYKNKCAYCEQKVESFHVEHYRPKQTYFWLAYSWDNLISACAYCNEYKSTDFQVTQPRATLAVNITSLRNINTLSKGYDATENPDLINPEVTNPHGSIVFHDDGNITSADAKFAYTINTCRIDRTYLKDRRKKIIDDLRRDLRAAFVDNATTADQAVAIRTIVTKFMADWKDVENEFLAFRKYVIDHWLPNEIKNAKN
jgi:uncharacterized protein (TIGR02646 family)